MSRFLKNFRQRSKNLQNMMFIGCGYAEVNQQIQCFAYVKCFWRDVYKTDLNFSTFFQVTGKWVNYSDRFFLLKTNIKAIFSITSRLPISLCQKFKKDLIYFMFDGVFQYFLCSQSGSQGRVWYHRKVISYCAPLFKEIA